MFLLRKILFSYRKVFAIFCFWLFIWFPIVKGDIGNYYYGQGHPMKPHRIRMTHNLLLNYGLYRKMEIFRPHKATQEEMTKFHSDDYIRFLRSIRPDNMGEYNKQMQRFNVGEDCPVFDGLYEFCQLSAGVWTRT